MIKKVIFDIFINEISYYLIDNGIKTADIFEALEVLNLIIRGAIIERLIIFW